MGGIIVRRVNLVAVLVGAALVIGAIPVVAQDESPPNVAETWRVKVPLADAPAFEAAFKAHIEAREAAGDPWSWQTYVNVVGGEIDVYTIQACCHSWADMDTYAEWVNGSGLMADWATTVGQYIDHYAHEYSVFDLENSNWPADPPDYRLFGITSWVPRPGAMMSTFEAVAKLSSIGKENGWSLPWAWSSRIGGEAQLSVITPYMSFADMEEPSPNFFEFVAEQVGPEEAAKLFTQFGEGFWSSRYRIVQHRPDLSMSDGE